MSDLHEGCAFAGDSYLVLDRPLSALVQHIAKTLNKQIHCNCPVSKIEHNSNGALVSLYGGRYVTFHVYRLVTGLAPTTEHPVT